MNYNSLDTSLEDIGAVMDECWDTLMVESILDDLPGADTQALDRRLREVIDNAETTQTELLVAWLRASFNWSDRLQYWQPLLHATHRIALTRHPQEIVEDLLMGLLPTGRPGMQHNSRK